MRTKQGYIIVIVVMLCVAGLCTYGLQGVIEEQQSALWIEPTLTTQQDWTPAVQPMQGVRHNFTPTAIYTPSAAVSIFSVGVSSPSYTLSTLSSSTVHSYGGSVGRSQVGTMMAHAPQAAVAVPMAQVNPLMQRTAVVQPIQVAPRQNRMLAQGRAQAVGNYGGSVATHGSTSGTYAGSGPMKAPSMPSVGGSYQDWLNASGATDRAGLEAWWNANMGGGWVPDDVRDDFFNWADSQFGVPMADGMICLLVLLLLYSVKICFSLKNTCGYEK